MEQQQQEEGEVRQQSAQQAVVAWQGGGTGEFVQPKLVIGAQGQLDQEGCRD